MRFFILFILLSNAYWLAIIVCRLDSSKSICTSAAFGKTPADEGAIEGSFSICWLWLAYDGWGSETAGVVVLSYLGVEVSNSEVCVVTGVTGIS